MVEKLLPALSRCACRHFAQGTALRNPAGPSPRPMRAFARTYPLLFPPLLISTTVTAASIDLPSTDPATISIAFHFGCCLPAMRTISVATRVLPVGRLEAVL